MNEPIRCIWCGRTKEDHQAFCREDGSESTEGRIRLTKEQVDAFNATSLAAISGSLSTISRFYCPEPPDHDVEVDASILHPQ